MTAEFSAVVVAAHGSRAEAANDAHRGLVDRLAARSPWPAVAAFLELAEPSIGDAIDDAVSGGASRVLVLPYFLYQGRHMTEDLPAIVADAARRHPSVTVRLLGLFGDDPALVALVARHVDDALGIEAAEDAAAAGGSDRIPS